MNRIKFDPIREIKYRMVVLRVTGKLTEEYIRYYLWFKNIPRNTLLTQVHNIITNESNKL